MNLREFDAFLKTVDLAGYREKYKNVRQVEMNMPKYVRAIDLLYRIYWNKKRPLSFEQFYKLYLKEKVRELRRFRREIDMCNMCFKKGIEARMYRTWAGLITQIHAGYVAERVFGRGTVRMSEELDSKNADIQIHYKGKIINYDVKKIAHTGVMGRGHAPKRRIPGQHVAIRYAVPSLDMILHPEKKRGKGNKKAYTDFYNKYLRPGKLNVFNNGFVVFEPNTFKPKKAQIDRARR